MEFPILLLFIFLLVVNGSNMFQNKRKDLVIPGAIHALGGILAVCAGNLLILLVSWEVLTFSAFYLLGKPPSPKGRRSAYQYLLMQVVSAVSFFTALVIHFHSTGSLAVGTLVSSSQPFILFAVMIKTASLPLHFWLADAYSDADPVVAPLLTGFTTKVGVLSAVRLLDFPQSGFPLFGYIGAVTAVAAVILALLQTNARKLLSYHIVSQVGFMTAAIGMGSPVAGLFHLITHTLYKSLLFFTAREASVFFGHEDLGRMGSLWGKKPGLALAGILGAIAISGVPFTSGYASKEVIKLSLYGTIPYQLLWLASVGTGLSFIKFTYLIFFRPRTGQPRELETSAPENHRGYRKWTVSLPIFLTAGASLLIGLVPGLIVREPPKGFWNLSSLIAAVYPLLVSVGGWILLKPFFISQHRSSRLTPATRWSWMVPGARKAEKILVAAHDQDPRFQIVLLILVFLLLLGSRFPV
jgi:multicomponent Na+:H+ antiporter subunit D